MDDGAPYGYHGAANPQMRIPWIGQIFGYRTRSPEERNAFAHHVTQGSKEALTGWLIIAECLFHIREYRDPDTGKPLSADQYLQAARQIGIRNRTDAMELPRLYPYIAQIWAKCDHDEAAAKARGMGYEYPGWRKAFAPFKPARDPNNRPPPLHRQQRQRSPNKHWPIWKPTGGTTQRAGSYFRYRGKGEAGGGDRCQA